MSTRSTRKIKTSSNIFSILQLQITHVNISQADTEAFFTDGILTMSLRSKSMGYLLLKLSMKGQLCSAFLLTLSNIFWDQKFEVYHRENNFLNKQILKSSILNLNF